MVKAIVFDLDGTLLDTLDDLHLSLNYIMQKFGYPTLEKNQVRALLGSGVKYLVTNALPISARDRVDEILPEFKEYYDIHKDDNTAPYDKVIEMLKAVKEKGYKTAIVSNKYDKAVQQLKNSIFSGYIDFALGQVDGVANKPAPDGVNLALEKLGVSKEEAVYVGDSEVDLLTAKNANLRCIACSWGFRDKDQLIFHGATEIIDSPLQLLETL
ncbi:MAG: HAD-IA family hydrolase [Clostridia bacterium]|nr:HAD-IA family hydrolase [Clostridia bacterium]